MTDLEHTRMQLRHLQLGTLLGLLVLMPTLLRPSLLRLSARTTLRSQTDACRQ
ncbi:hypothetical protein [Deinococcus sp. UYEF24]